MKVTNTLVASLALLVFTACELPEDDGKTAADRAEVNDKKKAGNKDESGSKDAGRTETVGQENARRSAEGYLDLSAFSRSGLIEQLEFEGYSTKDATYGVDSQKADWNKQAAASAEAYLELSAFSRSGLIDQLVFEGFTPAQAEYGVNKIGL